MSTSVRTQEDDGGRERRRRELMAVCEARQHRSIGATKRDDPITGRSQPKHAPTVKAARWRSKESPSSNQDIKRDRCEQSSNASVPAAVPAENTGEEAAQPDLLSEAASLGQTLEKLMQKPQEQQDQMLKAAQHQDDAFVQHGEVQHGVLRSSAVQSRCDPCEGTNTQPSIETPHGHEDASMPRKVVSNLQPRSDVWQKPTLFTSEDAFIPRKVVSSLQPKIDVQHRPTLLTSRTQEKTKLTQLQRFDSGGKDRAPVPPGLISRASRISPPPGTWTLAEPESEPSAISESVVGGPPSNPGVNHNKIFKSRDYIATHSQEDALQYLERDAVGMPRVNPWEVSGFQSRKDFDEPYAGTSAYPILSTIPDRPPVAHSTSWAYQGAANRFPQGARYHHLRV